MEGRIIVDRMISRVGARRHAADAVGEDSCDETPEHVPPLIAATYGTVKASPKSARAGGGGGGQ